MRILFVHGFGGGKGGGFERALDDACRNSSHSLIPIRWDAGALGRDASRSALQVVAEVVSDANLVRGVARAVAHGAEVTSRKWESALAATTAAQLRLRGAIRKHELGSEEFSIIGFSLGCKVVLQSLAMATGRPRNLCRVVLAGAATPRASYQRLPKAFLDRDQPRLVHVWSANDSVLSMLYPLLQDGQAPAGLKPLCIDGIRDMELGVGHTGYAAIAGTILEVASESP